MIEGGLSVKPFNWHFKPRGPKYIIIGGVSAHRHCSRALLIYTLPDRLFGPILSHWPAAVLVLCPHVNGNAQRRPRGASLGLAMFSSRPRLCCFLCTSNGHMHPRGKSNRLRGCPKTLGRIPCFLAGPHWRFFGLLACLPYWHITTGRVNRGGRY